MALLKLPSNTIHIANTYIAGFDVMTAHWSPYVINPAGQNTIPKHIQIDVKFVPSACLTVENASINIQPLMSSHSGVMWKPLKSTAPTLP